MRKEAAAAATTVAAAYLCVILYEQTVNVVVMFVWCKLSKQVAADCVQWNNVCRGICVLNKHKNKSWRKSEAKLFTKLSGHVSLLNHATKQKVYFFSLYVGDFDELKPKQRRS